MENQIIKAHYLGHYSFSSKDKNKIYYKLQAVVYTEGHSRALIIDTFVNDKEFDLLKDKAIFDCIDLELFVNLSTGKIGYKILS